MSIIPLRIAAAYGEPGAFAGLEGALPADYALFAGQAFVSSEQSKRASPANYALFAGEAAASDGQPKRKPYRAAAASLAFHLTLLALFLLGPAGRPREHLGAPEGQPDKLNVAVITEADLKSMSMDPFRQESSLSATPSPPSPPTPLQETKNKPEETETKTKPEETEPKTKPEETESKTKPEEKQEAAQQAKAPVTQNADDPFGFAAKWTERFSASMTHAFNAPPAQSQRKTAAPSASSAKLQSFRPAATHKGQSDEFERQVIWALAATKPTGNGNWGITVVSFVISEQGRLQDLQLLQASGDNWLDKAALFSVRQARLPVPPAGLPAGDRTFHVTYIAR